MRLKIVSLIVGLALLSFAAGCGNGSSDSKDPKAQAQRAVNTYLEGLRDLNYDKLKKTVTYSIYESWPKDRAKFKEMMAGRQKSTGDIKSWTLEENPYIDEVNNQVIMRATVTTDKYRVILKFDLRKKSDEWRVYGVETERTIGLTKQKGNSK